MEGWDVTRHPAFEKAIDENPLEATNHLVYADWLDEQGEHDEAAFRRVMGDWVQKLHDHKDTTIGAEIYRPVKRTNRNGSRGEVKFPWLFPANGLLLPGGIEYHELPTWNHGDFHAEGRTFFRPDGTGYWPQDPTHGMHTHEGKRYATYRNLEGAIRNAFIANRAANPERQSRKMSRIVRARRRVN